MLSVAARMARLAVGMAEATETDTAKQQRLEVKNFIMNCDRKLLRKVFAENRFRGRLSVK